MHSKDTIGVLIAARAGVYRALQTIFGNEPSAEILEQLGSNSFTSIASLFYNQQDSFDTHAKALASIGSQYLDGNDAVLDTISANFTRLFVGPTAPEAPPWESYYIGSTHSLFQTTTLEVRKAYVAQNFIPAAYPSVADDHIGIELDFLTRLAERAGQFMDAGETENAKVALYASEQFIKNHPLKWVANFSKTVSTARHGYYYTEAAAMLEAFLPIDIKALRELQAALL